MTSDPIVQACDAAPASPEPNGGEPDPRRGAGLELAAQVATPAVFLIVLLGVYGPWLGSTFFDAQQRVFDVYQNVAPLLISIGVLVAMTAHVFDLSAAFMATMSSFLTVGLTVQQGLPLGASMIIALAAGAVLGLTNALLVVGMRIHAFIATLGTGGIVLGAYTMYSGGLTIGFADDPRAAEQVAWFSGASGLGSFGLKTPWPIVWLLVAVLIAAAWTVVAFRVDSPRRSLVHVGCAVGAVLAALAVHASGVVPHVNFSIVVLLLVALGTWAVLRWTRLGRHIAATGGNPAAAALAGVRTGLVTSCCYVFSGVVAALAGILLAANQGSATAGLADGYLLPAYASVFLSTVILSAGRFHVWGAVVGGIATLYIAQGLVAGGVGFTWTDLVNGVVLVLAVSLSTLFSRRSGR